MTTKEMMGGSDGGAGGVGYAVPADYGKKKPKTALGATAQALPEDSPIRKRAEKLESDYEHACASLAALEHQAQQETAVATYLLSQVRTFHGKLLKMQADVNNRGEAKALAQKFKADTWARAAGTPVRNYSDKLSASVEALTEDADETTAEASYQYALGALDLAMGELETVSQSGTPGTAASIQAKRAEIERMAKDMGLMQSQLKAVVIKQGLANIKSDNRLMDAVTPPVKDEDVEGGIPTSVPNYRMAIDASPRVCGNCRFFKGESGVEGKCTAFDFTAKANYVCDAWQARELTGVHTIVRDDDRYEGSKMMSSPMVYSSGGASIVGPGVVQGSQIVPTTDLKQQFEVGVPYMDTTETGDENAPKTTPGVVYGSQVQELIPQQDREVGLLYNNDETLVRAAQSDFLPGDIVYAKSLRSLAKVQTVVIGDGGLKMYGLSLIDAKGLSWGSAATLGTDLQMRSKAATKTVGRGLPRPAPAATKSSEASEEDLEGMIDTCRSVYKALQAVVDAHADFVSAPMTNKDVLSPLRAQLVEILQSPEWAGAKVGPKRKYYRAMQNAMVGVGAARQVLFDCYRTVNAMKDNGNSDAVRSSVRQILLKAQEDAYERVVKACSHVKDALTLPSATHDYQAPGLGE